MIENNLVTYGYFAIFLITFLNGILSNTLTSSQITFLICGYFIALGKFDPVLVISIGLIARTIGNQVTYEIIRKYGLSKKIRKFFKIKDILLNKLKIKLFADGLVLIFMGKILPATHWVIPVLCGLSKTNRNTYFFLMLLTNLIWISLYTYLGFLFGKSFVVGIYYLLGMTVITIFYLYFLKQYLNLSKKDFL